MLTELLELTAGKKTLSNFAPLFNFYTSKRYILTIYRQKIKYNTGRERLIRTPLIRSST